MFRRILKRTSVNPDGRTPRALRHGLVWPLPDHGVPLKEISRLAGHSGTTVTDLVYRKRIRPVVQAGAMVMDQISGD